MSLLLILGGPADSSQTVDPAAVASAEAVTGPLFLYDQFIDLSAIASGSVANGPGISGGPQSFTPAAVASAEVANGPSFSFAQVIGLSAIPSAAVPESPSIVRDTQVTPRPVPAGTGVITGPSFSQTGLPASPDYFPRVQAWLFDRDFNFDQALPDSYGRRWQDRLNDAGSGELRLQNDDAALASIGYRSVVVFLLDDTAVFSMLVERLEQVSIDPNEEVDEVTTVTGRGLAAVFEEGVVVPSLGVDRAVFQDTRYFNFGATDLDTSSWEPAAVVPTEGHIGGGEGFLPKTAWMIWDRADLSPTGPPIGDVYLTRTFTVVADMSARAWAAANDAYDVYLDGSPLMSDGWKGGYTGQSRSADIHLDIGVHIVTAHCRNLFANRAWFRFGIHEIDADGVPLSTVVQTDPYWYALGYPPGPPGFTPGQVIRILVGEAQSRGALAGVDLAFTDDADSYGEPWPVTTDIAVPVGSDLLSVLQQLCETYLDIAMAPASFTLYAVVARGVATTVTLAPQVNLTTLHHTTEV